MFKSTIVCKFYIAYNNNEKQHLSNYVKYLYKKFTEAN